MFENVRYSFEKDWNEKRYWKLRNYIQNHREGKLLAKIAIMLCRRIEAKNAVQQD